MSKSEIGRPSYGFALKWVLAVILIVVGVVFKFNTELVYLVTGGVVIVFSIFRVYSLMKSLNKEILRTLNLIEIVLDTILGVILLVIGIKSMNDEVTLSNTWQIVYKYSLVFIFSMRAVIFFYSITFLGEKTEQVKFWAHLALLPLATVIVANKNFDSEWVGWLLLVISVVGGVYLIYDGTGGYGKYRLYQKALNEQKVPKQKEIEERKDVILDKEEEDRPYIS